MNNAIKSSLEYIINDFSKEKSIEIQFYSDIFKILKLAIPVPVTVPVPVKVPFKVPVTFPVIF